MNRFLIKHAFYLKSADKLLLPNQYFQPTSEAQVKELTEVFAQDGACEELVSKPKEAKETNEAPPADPNQDLSAVKGVGKATLEKLTSKGITTVDQLKTALADPSQEPELKKVFGANLKKIQAQFSE